MSVPLSCPYCGGVNDQHDSIDGPEVRPTHGDTAICWRCNGVSVFVQDVFDGRLSLERPDQDQYVKIRQSPEVRQALLAMRRAGSAAQAVRAIRQERTSGQP